MHEDPRGRTPVSRSRHRYRLVRELGSGGMASVHLAREEHDEGLVRLVAFKRMHDHRAAEPGYRAMFFDEALLTSRIAHPNVCKVHDFGEHDGDPYIALEYLSGETFARLIEAVRARPWAPEWPFRAATLVAAAAEGLHAAHELRDAENCLAGVVHRDVSPSNLFATYGGEVKVLDFGIARPAGGKRTSDPRVGCGKAAYMAPEQLAGHAADRRADVWSLGVTLWEMLALTPLFQRDDPSATIGAVASAPIAPPSSKRGRVPAALDAIVLRALERHPARRFATARELGRALVACCREHVEVFDAVDMEEFMGEVFAVEQWRKRAIERDALSSRETSGLLRFGGRADGARRTRQAAS